MERDIPHRDTPGTLLFINFNSKYFNDITPMIDKYRFEK